MSRERRVRTKSEVVRRSIWVSPPRSGFNPGHARPRFWLSFVLKMLAGNDSGMTEMHLSVSDAQWEFKKAWDRVFADPLSRQIVKNSMITMMRYLADLWIDSGKSGEGENRVDNPSRRNVEYRTPAGTPSREIPVSGGNAIPIPTHEPISDLFYRLIGNETRLPQIHKDGTQSLKEQLFGFNLKTFDPDYRFKLRDFGMKAAMYWFAKLLDSPFSHRLARCDDCGTYFAYERAPRTDIKGGSHCRNCKKCGSAKRMKSTRDKRIAEMVRFAAEFYGQFKPNSRQPLTKWIAEHVNRRTESIRAKAGKQRMSHYPAITGRWVTQHQAEIEAEVERRSHATRKN